jgi:hypothetical protein
VHHGDRASQARELVGACNLIWYQSQRSRVRILVSAIK